MNKIAFLSCIFLISLITQAYGQTDQIREEFCQKNWRENRDMCADYIPEGYYDEVAPKEFTEDDQLKLEQIQRQAVLKANSGNLKCPEGTYYGLDNDGNVVCRSLETNEIVTPFANVFFDEGYYLSLGIIILIIIIIAVVLKFRSTAVTLSPEIETALQNNFQNYDSRRFEEFVADIFKRNGYDVKVTPPGPDQGVDVFAKKGGEKIVIQAKCWQNKVSNGDVLKTLGSMKTFAANRAVVITNSDFTRNARELLASNRDLELINMDGLRELIKKSFKKN